MTSLIFLPCLRFSKFISRRFAYPSQMVISSSDSGTNIGMVNSGLLRSCTTYVKNA